MAAEGRPPEPAAITPPDDALLGVSRRVAAAGIPPMAMDEIVAEVKASRTDRRSRALAGLDRTSSGTSSDD